MSRSPSAGPNPTGAVGVDSIVKNKPVVNIPGCPPNPYILLGTVLQFARTGTIPELDDKITWDLVDHRTYGSVVVHAYRRPGR